MDNAAAVATRRRVFGEYANTPTLIIGTHLTGPTAGKLVRYGNGYRWKSKPDVIQSGGLALAV
jgi:hypothetical protein